MQYSNSSIYRSLDRVSTYSELKNLIKFAAILPSSDTESELSPCCDNLKDRVFLKVRRRENLG